MPAVVDVAVVGGGNAALCAALSAAEQGARVLLLERAPHESRGGNSRFSAGSMRVGYRDAHDLARLMPDLTDAEWNNSDFGSYPAESFFHDLAEVTDYRTDPELAHLVAYDSFETLEWIQGKGVRFLPLYGTQAFEVEGVFRFWGGLVLQTVGGGEGLVSTLSDAAREEGVQIHYKTRAVGLKEDRGRIRGLVAQLPDGSRCNVETRAVILAAGGFQANTEWRTRYLGPGWDLAKVRGSRFNTGDGIRMALEVGASTKGNWSGCHSVAWDLNAPEFGDLSVGDAFQKHSYPFGIMVNARGERFVDEGADFRNYTYAKYGGEILRQPGHAAWQIFDSKSERFLRDEYRIREVSRVRADSLEELADLLEVVDGDALLSTVRQFNESIAKDVPFNPNVRDGRCARGSGLSVPKSNWALALDEGPYEAYAVTCGITFTFGGLRVTERGQVISSDGDPIQGLYAAGEMVGGLYYFNYPGGSGLTSGAVLGRVAGASAAST